MEIMLHLGAHRSASTTFQTYLWDNRHVLARQGLTSWTPKRTRDGLMRGLMKHPALMSIEDERRGFRSVGRIRVEIERLQRTGQKGLLISEENMIGTMANNLADMRLYPLTRERLMRFAPAFEGRKMRIGLSIRSYEDFWTSSLASLIARGRDLPSKDDLDFLTTQPRRWRHIVRDIAETFPEAEVFVWPFERLAGQPEFLLQHFWPAGAKRRTYQDLWCNRSPSLVQMDQLLISRGEAPSNKGVFDASTRWMPFDEDQRSVLRAEYRRDLAWLMSGAQGYATFVDGRKNRATETKDGRPTPASNSENGQKMPLERPDRAEDTRTAPHAPVHIGGRQDGIKEGLGRAGAT